VDTASIEAYLNSLYINLDADHIADNIKLTDATKSLTNEAEQFMHKRSE
jgi:hypothetical protein